MARGTPVENASARASVTSTALSADCQPLSTKQTGKRGVSVNNKWPRQQIDRQGNTFRQHENRRDN